MKPSSRPEAAILPPQWRDTRISLLLLYVFARHSGTAPTRVVILAQPESPYWPLHLPHPHTTRPGAPSSPQSHRG
jgi:hypothetical protein